MTKLNIDEVSAEVKALIGTMKLNESSLAHDRKLAQPKLQLIWEALEAKQPVCGCKSKGEWAKYAGVTTRYCQYILKDGSRKDQKKKDANSVRPVVRLKPGTRFEVKTSEGTMVFEIAKGKDRPSADDQVSWKRPWHHCLNSGDSGCECGGKKFTNVTLHGVVIVEDRHDEKEEKPAPKKKEEKKPVKHAKNTENYGMTWCRTEVSRDNTAHQTRYATCPYCIAAMAAGVRVINPKPERRRLERELDQMQDSLEHAEKHSRNESHIAELREDVAMLKQKLAAIKNIKTPEQAVEAAKKAAAEREAQKKAQVTVVLNEENPSDREWLEKKLADHRNGVSRQSACPDEEAL